MIPASALHKYDDGQLNFDFASAWYKERQLMKEQQRATIWCPIGCGYSRCEKCIKDR